MNLKDKGGAALFTLGTKGEDTFEESSTRLCSLKHNVNIETMWASNDEEDVNAKTKEEWRDEKDTLILVLVWAQMFFRSKASALLLKFNLTVRFETRSIRLSWCEIWPNSA